MKKMNNKGVTLVELIVSFAIVGVAVVYFYQTVSTVSKLYKTSKDDTNDYVNSTYVLRLVDAKLDDLKKTYKSTSGKNIDLTKDEAKNNLSSFCSKLSATCTVTNPSSTNTDDNYHKYVISVTTGGKNYKLYRRATIKTKVGTKVEKYVGTVGVEKKTDKFNLTINNDAIKKEEQLYLTDDTLSEFEEKFISEGDKNIYRANFEKVIVETGSDNYDVNSNGVWRKFLVLTEDDVTSWESNADPTVNYYGLYNSEKKITSIDQLVEAKKLKVGDILLSAVNANNVDLIAKETNSFKCQGLIIQDGLRRVAACTNTLASLNNNYKNIAMNWFNLIANSNRYSPSKWTVTGITCKNLLLKKVDCNASDVYYATVSYKKEEYRADTLYYYNKNYELYAYED